MRRLVSLTLLLLLATHTALAQDTVAPNPLLAQIQQQHDLITRQCNTEGIADKERARNLKNIYYSYLSIYNKHTTAATQQEELLRFQQHLRDSVLSISGYQAHIDNFKNTLKLRAGKDYIDIYKSYCRTYQPPIVAANFTNLDEYRAYVARLREIVDIQDAYLASVELNQQVQATSASILALYSKPSQASAYKNMMATISLIPSFTQLDKASEYMDKMLELAHVQQLYIDLHPRVSAALQRSDSIYSLGRKYSDITAAFRIVDQSTPINPNFCTLHSYSDYSKTLATFEQLQQLYLHSIYLRDTLETNEIAIQRCPKTLRDGYRNLRNYTPRTPDFNTIEGGDQYIQRQHLLLAIQLQCLAINEDIITQQQLETDILALTKRYSYIRRLYNDKLKSFTYRSAIATPDDLAIYATLQQQTIEFQRALISIVNSSDPEALDKAIRKGEKIEL